MNAFQRRRRALMMQAAAAPAPVVPSGYVSSGIIFFLDGLQSVSATQWEDIIGGKVFALNNCSINADNNGVVFNGSTSYGVMDGAVTDNFEGETIEIAINQSGTIVNKTAFCQPYVNQAVGISMRFGYEASNRPRFAMGLDGVTRNFYYTDITQNKNVISGNADMVIVNGTTLTKTHSTYYSKNTTGKTYVGAHATTGNLTGYFSGTIHAIRIYNRKLTQAEILQNQAADVLRYGLS